MTGDQLIYVPAGPLLALKSRFDEARDPDVVVDIVAAFLDDPQVAAAIHWAGRTDGWPPPL